MPIPAPLTRPSAETLGLDDFNTPPCAVGVWTSTFRIRHDRVLKVPVFTGENTEESTYLNDICINVTQNEGQILRRSREHHGIIKCFDIRDGMIELAYAHGTNLRRFIEQTPMPSEETRRGFLVSLVDTLEYVHARRVLVRDIELRNILIQDGELKLAEFGTSYMLPEDTEMESISVYWTTPEVEILHLGCVLYSVAAWREFRFDYYKHRRWPRPDQLPSTDGVLGGYIIRNCWGRRYRTMEALVDDMVVFAGRYYC